jgi:hypothetical protein
VDQGQGPGRQVEELIAPAFGQKAGTAFAVPAFFMCDGGSPAQAIRIAPLACRGERICSRARACVR